MKRACSIVMISLLLLGLTACNSGAANNAAADPSAKVYKLVIGATVQDESASGIALLDYFKPYIEEKSNGQITVEVQNNSVLGSDRELYEALQLNTVQACFGPMSTLANFEPNYSVCDLPFLFSSMEVAYANLDGEFGAKLAENLPNVGMRLMAYGENAFRNISNNKKPILKLEDLKGLKLRVMESPVNLATYSALGCNPTPMAFSELYTGLQQGTVEGQDNGVVLTYTAKLYEVQKYYSFIGQTYAATGIVVSESFWQSLPPELQQVVQDGALYATENQRRLNSEMEATLIKKMEEAGIQISYLDKAELARFREATLSVWDKFAASISPEIFEMAVSIRDGA